MHANWRRAAAARLQLVAALASAVVLAHACDDPSADQPRFRHLGGGLVLTPSGQVVDVFSLPDAISAEELEFWRGLRQSLESWPVTTPSRTVGDCSAAARGGAIHSVCRPSD